MKPDITNITRYSARPYTKAKTMKGRIKTEVVKNRSRILTNLSNKISKENNLRHVGKRYKILITKKGKNNTFIGRAENYKPVIIKQNVKIGSLIPVEIIDTRKDGRVRFCVWNMKNPIDMIVPKEYVKYMIRDLKASFGFRLDIQYFQVNKFIP